MMAAIFLMQSVGRFLAVGIGLGSLRRVMHDQGLNMAQLEDGTAEVEVKIVIDIVWRIVIGMGGVIALIAVGLRFIIPESPRYYSGIQKDLRKAALAVKQVGGTPDDLRSELSVSSGAHHRFHREEDQIPWTSAAIKYLRAGGWRALAGMSSIWLLLDVCFYGTSLDSPGTLNALWLSSKVYTAAGQSVNGTVAVWNVTEPVWNSDPGWPNATIQQTLSNNTVRTLLLSSIASLVGSLVAIPVVHFANRRRLLMGTSLALTLLFIATGTSVVKTYGTSQHAVSMVFFALTQFMFNLGPNTLTFILPAEIFPTIFRGTFYGISAASGKLGAIIVRAIVARAGNDQRSLTAYLFVFSVIMLILALIVALTSALPEVQYDLRKAAVQPESSDPDIEGGEQLSHDETGRKHWWDVYLARRWRSKALEEIGSPMEYEEAFVSPREDASGQEKELHPVSVVVPADEASQEHAPGQNNYVNEGLAPEEFEGVTRDFQSEIGQRFSSPLFTNS